MTTAILLAALTVVMGTVFLDLSLWAALLLYSSSGTAATFFVAWRRYRCADRSEI